MCKKTGNEIQKKQAKMDINRMREEFKFNQICGNVFCDLSPLRRDSVVVVLCGHPGILLQGAGPTGS